VRWLNEAIHPLVRREINVFLKRARKKSGVVVVEAPLLLEAGWAGDFDAAVVVAAGPKAVARRRRPQFDAAQARQRSRFQWPLKKKIAQCDFVIDNGADKRQTYIQVKRLFDSLRKGATVRRHSSRKGVTPRL